MDYKLQQTYRPVIELDGEAVGDGLVGPVWEKAMTIYESVKYDY